MELIYKAIAYFVYGLFMAIDYLMQSPIVTTSIIVVLLYVGIKTMPKNN